MNSFPCSCNGQRIESRQQALEKRKAADLAEVALVAAKREKRRADQANAVSVISVIDFEKSQDDLRNAELAYEHAVADADLFDERLAFELRASELELGRQELLVRDLQRRVDGLALVSAGKWGCRGSAGESESGSLQGYACHGGCRSHAL